MSNKKNIFIIVAALVIISGIYWFYDDIIRLFPKKPVPVLTKSMLAKDVALTSWNFIDQSALNKERRGYIDFWRTRFICKKGKCVADKNMILQSDVLSTYLPPALYVEDLRLFATVTKDPQFNRKRIAETLFLTLLCGREPDVCRRQFTAIVNGDADYKKVDPNKFAALLIVDVGLEPKNLLAWFQKLERFIALAKFTKNPKHLEVAEKVFKEGEKMYLEPGSPAYREGDIAVTSNSCYKPLGEIKMYELTQNSMYRDAALAFVDQSKIYDHAADLSKQKVMRGRLVHPALVCAELLASLYENTKESKYLGQLKKVMQYLMTRAVDFKAERTIATGDGAFIRNFGTQGKTKHSIDTLWFVNILLRIPNEEFQVPL
ncbi:MAG: hypothetical protein HYT98_02810 [Candidatus Sungbacteria bacterium]|nr:hypothetical protein [Candidatus Sungbacteria bacterium]